MGDGYDTDAISITSTVPSEVEDSYQVKDILAVDTFEDDDGEDEVRYLVEWLNYPFHRCSWEPESSFSGHTDLIDKHRRKEREGGATFQHWAQNNIERWENAVEDEEAARALRLEKRAKKRKKLRMQQSLQKASFDDDSTDDDEPLLNRMKDTNSTSKVVGTSSTRKNSEAPRKPLKDRPSSPAAAAAASSSSSSSSPLSDDLDSEGSLMEELAEKRCRERTSSRKKSSPKIVRADSSYQKEKRGIARSRVPSPEIRKSESSGVIERRLSKDVAATPRDQSKKSGSKISSKFLDNNARRPSTTLDGTPSTSANAAPVKKASALTETGKSTPTFIKRSAPKPIKMVNAPNTTPGRKAWENGATELYSKMHFRRKAELRARNEKAPDPSALQFVNGSSGGLAKPATRDRDRDDVDDNPYSRRDTTRRRAEEEREEPTEAPAWESRKVPMTCFEWRNGSCQYSAERCRFLHRDTDEVSPWDGSIPPKYRMPPVTCWWWMRDPKGCTNSEKKCQFTHYNTGLLGNLEGRPATLIEKSEQPEYMKRLVQLHSAVENHPEKQTLMQQGRPKENSYETHNPTQQIDSRMHESRYQNMAQSPIGDSRPTCTFWRKGYCKFKDRCNFAHYETGHPGNRTGKSYPPREDASKHPHREDPLSSLTCFFWTRGSCKRGDNCPYAHYDTGKVAYPPPNWVKRPALDTPSRSNTGFEPMEIETPTAVVEDSFSPLSTRNHPLPPPKSPLFMPKDSPPAMIMESPQKAPPSSSIEVKQTIEDAFKLDFKEMFVKDEGIAVDRRAFLLFHPEDHKMELELITRWLLMHHVEVFNFWKEGAWDYFKQQIVKGGTGVMITHPEFYQFWKLPDFREVIRRNIRIWAVGHQRAVEYDPDIMLTEIPGRYDRIELFPLGGVIYITDDVFTKQPQHALRIIQLFFDRIKACCVADNPPDEHRLPKDGLLLWRLAVRPDFMEAVYQWCSPDEENLDPDSLAQRSRTLYKLLSSSGFIPEDEVEPSIYAHLPEDYFPIMSLPGAWKPDFFPALKRSGAEANDVMVEFYAQWMIDHARDYRHFFVVHTEPQSSGWMEKWAHLDEVMTPEKCIEYLRMPTKGARFDFMEWAAPRKGSAGAGDVVMGGE
ncbi:hypothetical protein BCR34DRAFT_380955 [Clohesyomyces aquaticus]|uniref:Chromo domain-containing protein n=1 Tax=Clohesyomyces aquaticus TaxID=1231657 RepID=A0A1Y2A6U1_9PLEO|nr:hypothetical protein BCR34DRAFT_380955 [Clohesyomyces aquaticus]